MNYVWGKEETKYFYELTPELILDTANLHGFSVTGRCLTLNSMENRVYEIEIDNKENYPELSNPNIVAKFYRPGRWTKEQIIEEHQFMEELTEADIQVIAPMKIDGETLFKLEEQNLYYTFFPKKGGRAPDEMNIEQLEIMGRMLARLHNIGSRKKSGTRITISPQSFGKDNLNFLLSHNILPVHLQESYKNSVHDICNLIVPLFENIETLRIHGDCHLGNIISRESEGMFFIDFDDHLFGPAVQDIWLITPGIDEESKQNQEILLESYQTMRNFNRRELKLIEPLRTLRFIHFSAWISKRWEDPAFKVAFPHFEDHSYWETQLNDLIKQKQLIQNSLEQSF